MKKIISLFLTAIIVLSVCAVGVSAAPKLSKSSFVLAKGYATTLKVTGTGKTVTWTSDNTAVATVSSGGKVVAKAVGTANIKATVAGTTLTCKVSVVATKITLTPETLTIGVGDTVTVTATVLGDKSGFSMANSNSAVAKGKFVSPARFKDNKIQFNVTGYRAGTASITLYRKNYRDTYFKAISVRVTDANNGYNQDATVRAINDKVEMEVGGTTQISVWASNPRDITAYAYDTTVVSVTRAGTSGNYVYFNLKALKAGKTSIKAYDDTDTSRYAEIPVTVKSKAEYYKVYETVAPTKLLATDELLSFTYNSKNYYLLVPYDYDVANTNTIIAQFTKKYEYGKVYDKYPGTLSSTDIVKSFYDNRYTVKTLYVVLPKGYEDPDYDTVRAVYLDVYDYYTIYNQSPKKSNPSDYITSWTIKDLKTNKTTNRYMLLPSSYDQDKANQIRDNDQSEHNGYIYYVVYTTYPTNTRSGDRIYSWYKNNDSKQPRYLVAPGTEEDFIRRNDTIRKENNYPTYFTPYTDAISGYTISDYTKEDVSIQTVVLNGWTKRTYVLVDYTDPNWKTKLENCVEGRFYTTKAGDFYGNTSYKYN
jgi:uncharacterized protein YjdB